MAFEIPVNMNSVMVVRDELNKSLDNTIQYADAFLLEPADSGPLEKAIAELNQVNGILRVVEFSGAVELSGAVSRLAQSILEGKLPMTERYGRALGDGFHGLQRYVDYCIRQRRCFPLAVNTLVNELRRCVRQPLLMESEQVACRPLRQPTLSQPAPRELTPEELVTLRRLVHMYQAGLLAVLGDAAGPTNFHLMERALERLHRECSDLAAEEWWLLVRVVLRLFRVGELRATTSRKRMLAGIDAYLRHRVRPGVEAPIQVSEAHRCELLHLVLLAGPDSKVAGDLATHYGLEATADDRRLASIEAALAGRSADELSGKAQVVREALHQIKEILENHRFELTDDHAAAVDQRLQLVAGVLGDAGFSRLKGMLSDHASQLADAMAAGGVETASLEVLAETLLMVETTLANPEQFSDCVFTDEGQGAVQLARSMLDEATGVLLNESKSAIATAKRGITAYIESSYDVNHVANVGTSLSMARGALQILGHPRAAEVLARCSGYIDSCRGSVPGEQRRRSVETLADALISIEYYLDELSLSDRENDNLLSIAEESIAELDAAA